MKPKNYYSRYDHFLKIDFNKVSSFKTIKDWLKGSKEILDVGCGVGHLTNYWGATGIDNDPRALDLARKRFPKTKFILCNIEKKLPFENQTIDAIVCYNVLEHLTNPAREGFSLEAKRVLKKEGRFIAGYIDEEFWFNCLLARLFKDYGINDPTHLVSWKIADFKKEIGKYFKIIDEKKTSPYGKFTFITKYLKGERVVLAKMP